MTAANTPTNTAARAETRLAIIADDPDFFSSVARLLGDNGYDVITFTSPLAFRQSSSGNPPDVLVVALGEHASDRLGLLEQLENHEPRPVVVMISRHGDIASSVRAMRAGAVDVLEESCDDDALLAAVARAADRAHTIREIARQEAIIRARWETLTPREREVSNFVIEGHLNKQIAAALGTTEKTVKVHRARAMAKMQAHSIVELLRMLDRLGADR